MLRTGRRGGPALASLLTVAAIAVSVQGHVLLHRCVEAGGSWAGVAVRLALLRDVPACPDGTLGLGAMPRGAIVLLSVALPALAAWVLTGALGISLSALVVRAVRVVITLVGRWVRLPRSEALPVADRAPARAATSPAPRPPLVLLVARPHRGPPLPA
jgi:hypothetical protein